MHGTTRREFSYRYRQKGPNLGTEKEKDSRTKCVDISQRCPSMSGRMLGLFILPPWLCFSWAGVDFNEGQKDPRTKAEGQTVEVQDTYRQNAWVCLKTRTSNLRYELVVELRVQVGGG